MNAAAALKSADVPFALRKADPSVVALVVTGRSEIAIRAGTSVSVGDALHTYETQTDILLLEDLVGGGDYDVWVDQDGQAVAFASGAAPDLVGAVTIGGFHFALGGNADGAAGGDEIPAINPFSCWDLNFRPSCQDPRGMALIADRFWCDIYLTSAQAIIGGNSHFGDPIADGKDLPDGYRRFDFDGAKAYLATFGKQLLGAEEFFAAAYGVTERSAAGTDPKVAGLDAPRTSRHGIMQATGNMWVWGTDGHPDAPRASIFGGSWIHGSLAGSRYAALGCYWPEASSVDIGARGRSDHLALV